MAAPTQTLTLDIHYSVFRRVIAPTLRQRLGGAAMQLRRLYERPVYEFQIRATHEEKPTAEDLYSFAIYHQGDIPFWFGGNQWGTVESQILVGFGDGVRTQFFLANRNITAGPTVQVAGTPTSVTLTASSGLITFASPPADQAKITALYNCRYKCVFFEEAEVLLSEEQFYNKLYRYDGITLRELVP